jgi:hypothetical protein
MGDDSDGSTPLFFSFFVSKKGGKGKAKGNKNRTRSIVTIVTSSLSRPVGG